jgi:asparagine synthase (glutamine-hydrolysing)
VLLGDCPPMKRGFVVRFTAETEVLVESDQAPYCESGCQIFLRGYVANRRELQSEFGLSREFDDAADDAKLMIHAYQKWGERLTAHVTGDFAVVVYDIDRQRVLLAHDELGLMPLFYAASGQSLVAATQLESIVPISGVGELDDLYIYDHLTEGWHLGKHTPYSHVKRLIPGQNILWQNGEITQSRVWTLDRVQPLSYRDPRECEEQLRTMTAAAIRSALPSEGVCWCELSGGLDSSSVMAFAAASGRGDLEAFSRVFSRTSSADEHPWIGAVLEKYPMPWHSLDWDAYPPFSAPPMGFYGEPARASLQEAMERRYAEMRAELGVAVVLTGVGGDATFLGDSPKPYYLADLFRTAQFRGLWRELRRSSAVSVERRPVGHFLTEAVIRPWWRHRRNGPLSSDPAALPYLDDRFARRFSRRGNPAADVPAAASIADSCVQESVLRCAQWIAMGHQRVNDDFRHPLMHRPLIAFMQSVPWSEKLHPACDRLLQRRAFDGILPERIVRRGNKPGPDELYYKSLNDSLEWIERLTGRTRDAARVVERGYVALKPWVEEVERARHGKTAGLRFFFACASLEVWLRQLEAVSPVSPPLIGRPLPQRASLSQIQA